MVDDYSCGVVSGWTWWVGAFFVASSLSGGQSFRWNRKESMRADGFAMQSVADGGRVRCARRLGRNGDRRVTNGSGKWWPLGPDTQCYWDRYNIVTGERSDPAGSGDGVAGC